MTKPKLPNLDSLLKAGQSFQKAKTRVLPGAAKPPKIPKGLLKGAPEPDGLGKLAALARAAGGAKEKPAKRGKK